MQCSNSMKSSTFLSGNSTSFMSLSLNIPTNIARKTGDHAASTSLWTYSRWFSTSSVTLESSSSTRKSKKSPSIENSRQFSHNTYTGIHLMKPSVSSDNILQNLIKTVLFPDSRKLSSVSLANLTANKDP